MCWYFSLNYVPGYSTGGMFPFFYKSTVYGICDLKVGAEKVYYDIWALIWPSFVLYCLFLVLS